MKSSPHRSGTVETPEGIRLAWEQHGAGDGPALVCCNGVGVSTFFWKYIAEHFQDRFPVVLWDYRGHGDSQRWAGEDWDLSIDQCARDLRLVLDAIGVEQAVLFGHSMGCQVIYESYRQDPDRVLGLVPMLGSAGRVLDTFYDNPRSVWMVKIARRLMLRGGDPANRFVQSLLSLPVSWKVTTLGRFVDPLYTSREDFVPYLDHLATLDLRLFLSMVLEAHRHDAFAQLPLVQVPTLVVAAERDDFTPVWLSERMAEIIPGAELLVLADASHAALIEQPETINHRLERFFRERLGLRSPPPSTSPTAQDDAGASAAPES